MFIENSSHLFPMYYQCIINHCAALIKIWSKGCFEKNDFSIYQAGIDFTYVWNINCYNNFSFDADTIFLFNVHTGKLFFRFSFSLDVTCNVRTQFPCVALIRCPLIVRRIITIFLQQRVEQNWIVSSKRSVLSRHPVCRSWDSNLTCQYANRIAEWRAWTKRRGCILTLPRGSLRRKKRQKEKRSASVPCNPVERGIGRASSRVLILFACTSPPRLLFPCIARTKFRAGGENRLYPMLLLSRHFCRFI